MQLHKARHNPEPDFILVQVALKGRLLTYRHNNLEEELLQLVKIHKQIYNKHVVDLLAEMKSRITAYMYKIKPFPFLLQDTWLL
jgi:hypothetical protein